MEKPRAPASLFSWPPIADGTTSTATTAPSNATVDGSGGGLWNVPNPDPVWTEDELEGAKAALQATKASYVPTAWESVPIIIDLGSHRVRAGFATESAPLLNYPPYYGRYRPWNSSEGTAGVTQTVCGNDLFWIPQTRRVSPFEESVLYHGEALECILDHSFGHLLNAERSIRVDDVNGIGHPVVVSETILPPKTSRSMLYQLLFECYAAPSATTGVDSMFSLYYDNAMNIFDSPEPYSSAPGLTTSSWLPSVPRVSPLVDPTLVVSCGLSSTHILPVTDFLASHLAPTAKAPPKPKPQLPVKGKQGKPAPPPASSPSGPSPSQNSLTFDANNSMRLNVGGHHATELLHKILALQSPANRGAMSYEMIEQVKHQHCFIAPHDYISTLREYQELSKAYTAAELDAAAQSNEDAMEQDSPVDEAIHILQLPFVVKEVRVETEEDRQRKEQRRLENAQRMRDLGAKKKQAQIIIRRARLDKLDGILIARKEGTAKQTPREEAPAPPKPASNGDDDDDEVIEDPAVAAAEEDARFNAMSDDEIRREMQEIRRYLHRAEGTAPPPQEQQPFIILTPEEEEAEYRVKFPLLYVADSELSPEQIKEKIKQRAMKNFAVGARRRQMEKLQNPDEPESAPAAAASQPSSAPSTPANNSKLTLVDKVLAREGSLEPSELLNSLHQLRKQLTDRIDVLRRRMANTQVGRQSRIAAKRMKLLAQAADEQTDDSDFGANDDDWDVYLQMQSDKDALAALATETGEEGIQDPTAQLAKDEAEVARIDAELAKRTDPAEYARKTRLEYQLCLGLERIRSPEVIMQPQMVGIDQMGLPEAIMTVINRFEVATRAKLLRRIYVTGGNAMWPTLQGRLTAELQPDVSVDLLAQSGLRVKVSPQSVWAPWRGAALFGLHHTSTSAFVSRQVYDEEGVERIIARRYHMASNPGWQYL